MRPGKSVGQAFRRCGFCLSRESGTRSIMPCHSDTFRRHIPRVVQTAPAQTAPGPDCSIALQSHCPIDLLYPIVHIVSVATFPELLRFNDATFTCFQQPPSFQTSCGKSPTAGWWFPKTHLGNHHSQHSLSTIHFQQPIAPSILHLLAPPGSHMTKLGLLTTI